MTAGYLLPLVVIVERFERAPSLADIERILVTSIWPRSDRRIVVNVTGCILRGCKINFKDNFADTHIHSSVDFAAFLAPVGALTATLRRI